MQNWLILLFQQAVVLKHNKTPRPVLRIAASRGFSELTKNVNKVVPWSLDTFPENFMQIGPAVFS